MSEAAVTQRGTRAPGDDRAFAPAAWRAPDVRRRLQLALGALWLLDAILQYQPVMFTRAFSQMLAATAEGNPAFVSRPILWDAHLVGQHPVALNTTFATIQLLLALGMAWRPTVRLALGASIVWALGVWWFGEGLGGVLTGTASPLSGAPGPVILYACWRSCCGHVTGAAPAGSAAPFVAARAVGAPAARALWLILWASLAYFTLLPANRDPQALHAMLAGMTGGEPAWLAAISQHGAGLLAHHGLAASIGLAATPGPDRRGRVPAAAGGPGRSRRGGGAGRRDRGGRPGPRRHPHGQRDRPRVCPVADLAGPRLLAGADRPAGRSVT